MIRVSGYSVGGRDVTTYHLSIQQWVWWKYWRHCLYEMYSLRFPMRVPGYKRLVKAMGGYGISGFGEEHGDFKGIRRLRSWTVDQDLRAFDLNEPHKLLATVEVSKEMYYAAFKIK